MKERFTIPQGGNLSEQFKGNSQDFDFGSNQYCRHVVCGVQGVFVHRQGRGGTRFLYAMELQSVNMLGSCTEKMRTI